MRLAVDIRSLSGNRDQTGVDAYVRGMLSGLREHQDISVVLISAGRKKPDLDFPVPKNWTLKHISHSNRVLNALWLMQSNFKLHDALSDADCLWLPNRAIVPRSIPVPVYLTIHDMSFEHMPEWYTLRGRVWHYATGVNDVVKTAKRIITVSDFTRDQFKRWMPEAADKAVTIRPATPATNAGTSNKRDSIVFIGTVEERKNIAAIITAWRLIQSDYPDVILRIAGKRGRLLKRTKMLLAETPRLEYHGYVSDTERTNLYARARAFIWPSLYEGYGFPPLEALSASVPVVTSPRASLPEVLTNKVYYARPYHADEIAAALRQALSTTSATEPVIARSWKQAADEFVNVITGQI